MVGTDGDDVLKQALRDFKRSTEITRDVRFQANLRLNARQKISSYMVSFLSLYVISLSLIPNIVDVDSFQTQILLACSIVLSVFVIFTSLIDGSQNFYHQGELLHHCARKVATVYHDLKNIDVDADRDEAQSELEKLQNRYRQALDECPINHANVDYAGEKARKPHLFPLEYGKNFRWVKWAWFRCYASIGPHLWMTLHAMAIVAVSLVVYVYVLNAAGPVSGLSIHFAG